MAHAANCYHVPAFAFCPIPLHTNQVVKNNWYGFLSWMGQLEGVIWKEVAEYDKTTTYDLVGARVLGRVEASALGWRSGWG